MALSSVDQQRNRSAEAVRRERLKIGVGRQASDLGQTTESPKSEVPSPAPALSLSPLRCLGDPNGFAVDNGIRRIHDHTLISAQAGDHFHLTAEVVSERDLLQFDLLARSDCGDP